jgi:hypothetical protein
MIPTGGVLEIIFYLWTSGPEGPEGPEGPCPVKELKHYI